MIRASLRRTLFRNIVVLVTLTVFGIGALAWWTARQEIGRLYDQQLVIGAEVLRSLMQEELSRAPSGGARSVEVTDDLLSGEDKKAFEAYAEWRMFRIWRGGRLALASDTGPPERGAPAASGFRWVTKGEKQWRIFTLISPRQGVVVELGERRRMRELLIDTIALDLVGPLLLLVPAVLALLWFGISAALRELDRLEQEIGLRSETDLSPLNVAAWPVELSGLTSGVNRLLAQVEHAFQRERRFTDHAAHQLKTPLATLKLQAQVARREGDPARLDEALSGIEAASNRATELVEQLLTLARLEEGLHAAGKADLPAEAAASISDAASAASHRGISFALLGADEARVAVDPVRLRLMLDNLIDNAVKHAPANTEVRVEIAPTPRGWRCSVLDEGPGVSSEDLEHAFEPFHTGSTPNPGFGLGLAIVAEAARSCAGEVRLETIGPEGGCNASLRLPAG